MSEEVVLGGVTLGWALDIVFGGTLDLTGMGCSLLWPWGVEGLHIRWQKIRSLCLGISESRGWFEMNLKASWLLEWIAEFSICRFL